MSYSFLISEILKVTIQLTVEEILGTNTQSEILEEAKENLKEAIYLVLETNKVLANKAMELNGIIKEPLILNNET